MGTKVFTPPQHAAPYAEGKMSFCSLYSYCSDCLQLLFTWVLRKFDERRSYTTPYLHLHPKSQQPMLAWRRQKNLGAWGRWSLGTWGRRTWAHGADEAWAHGAEEPGTWGRWSVGAQGRWSPVLSIFLSSSFSFETFHLPRTFQALGPPLPGAILPHPTSPHLTRLFSGLTAVHFRPNFLRVLQN